MISSILLAIALASASANGAVQLGNTLERRVPLSSGGWALASTSCPGGTSVITDGFCCPTTYQHVGLACCPSSSDCSTSLEATPYCANTDWVLWNSTTQSAGQGYFCCQDGDKGTDSMTCVANSTSVSAASAAARLGRPEPSGVTLGSASSATSTPSTSAATSSTTSSTSFSASASSTTHASNAVALLPAVVNVQGSLFLGLSCMFASIGAILISS